MEQPYVTGVSGLDYNVARNLIFDHFHRNFYK